MSMKTWKKKFYPIEAVDVDGGTIAAIEHSLLKWKGLKPKALEKHGLWVDPDGIYDVADGDRDTFEVNADTCALCQLVDLSCHRCPITLATGKRCDLNDHSPFITWLNSEDPKPMIAVLKKTLKHYQNNPL